ncbi:MAG: DeoR/GlpR family DNA-binding transcription regulator [Schaalia hyovaginalis]|uniref:DeoR/GlpR family DNA-binding transcription regulator n=1 Tax=Schaalia TaxID=2529408 RepID=UPI001F2459BE|nr:DeoR/GlpR family DNA-binding transcription regulator [Schaalia hyovaginalis]MCF2710461.1 DeoR/GlpR transcriptional regulator [Schaalia hyovaginalis]MCI6556371.1 DeoR/GlpR family DNA-binding transcription regulator [Schaalia hyovaginalis]MDY4263060.1 DeoR/GlpR family DNA-binding transcription regulator [Schaalia hyovaginalis]MDY4492275.1 DeoR/GlpR family DNA-binding transcription regulator [Schaalia hyovaginalis]
MNRHDVIVDMVNRSGFESVNSLATALNVNVSTVRRDLDALDAANRIRRTHGGAVPFSSAPRETAPCPQLYEKRAIGIAMAERILEGQTVFLDSGTTCLEVARNLQHRSLTVVTHDLPIASEILKHPALNLIVIGGELLPLRTHVWGPTAIDQLNRMRLNVAIFGTSSVMEDGIYGNSGYSLELQRTVRRIASDAFFVADSTKFGREAMYKILGIEDFSAGITDSLLSPITAANYPIPLIRAEVSP